MITFDRFPCVHVAQDSRLVSTKLFPRPWIPGGHRAVPPHLARHPGGSAARKPALNHCRGRLDPLASTRKAAGTTLSRTSGPHDTLTLTPGPRRFIRIATGSSTTEFPGSLGKCPRTVNSPGPFPPGTTRSAAAPNGHPRSAFPRSRVGYGGTRTPAAARRGSRNRKGQSSASLKCCRSKPDRPRCRGSSRRIQGF